MNNNKLDTFYNDFFENGFSIFNVENLLFLEKLRSQLLEQLNCKELDSLHKSIKYNEINNERIKCYRTINKNENWEKNYYSLAASKLQKLLGPDISIQSKLNLSIQMPNDISSVLDLHTDALSGQSVFEVVLWVPLTRSFDSNAMYIFSKAKELNIDLIPNWYKSLSNDNDRLE